MGAGARDLGECFIDGTLVGPTRGAKRGHDQRGQGTRLMAVVDRMGLPLAVHTASASPPEVPLVPDTLAASSTPERLIGDQAYGSDPLDVAPAAIGIERIALHRAHRKPPNTQDGRPFRRYKRRWKVARRFAWRQYFRRVLVRPAYQAETFLGCVHLGYNLMLLRCYV